MDNIKRRYVRVKDSVDKVFGYRGQPRGLIIYDLSECGTKLIAGASACHKNDSFNYRDANDLALKQLCSGNNQIIISLNDTNDLIAKLQKLPISLRPLMARIYGIESSRYALNQVGDRVYDTANGIV
jgi:hypothetical protein